ncbi:mannosyl-3-phosphoglycerate synthase [Candidatus Pelagisphaera phototrophica]|uniref:mannosyl-3-phosphoglycerate synthase n=1 Tax=Candidatus Pelagisphaera phototrophica TaxID=2684113 RepID=UPI001A087A8A|nr:mannosyl-3-phosphoglycerate synthase [Candidatus Pelagisphaera phototrophica]QXD33103.1 mannosyl-3-phosphoglycerate synthase [Candidatus Pelagisphaera phototrophica]
MRIEIPRECERIGSLQIYGLQKVYELDAGEGIHGHDTVIERIPSEVLYDRMREMAIVVPVKNERLKLIEGVLVGIPSPCQVIVVSNSPRGPVDRFNLEKEALENYGKFTGKKIMVVHQKDPGIAKAFVDAGYSELIDEQGLVRSGKAEGMIVGTLMAKWLGKKYLGFVDSDNYFPGAVMEYVYEYAAGFAMNGSTNTFVRISWHSKPKIMESSLFFAKWGRSSVNSNMMLNRLLTHFSGFETEIVKTGNAGEHALSVDLALKLEYAAGYAVETHHFIYLLEKYGGIIEPDDPKALQEKITICQIESRNPHMHESKGDDHVEDMIDASLSVIYHSPLCPELLKREIMENVKLRHGEGSPEEIAPVRMYPSLAKLDLDTFLAGCDKALNFKATSIRA